MSCQCEAQHASANAAAEHERHENEALREQALQVWDASMWSRGGLLTGWELKSWSESCQVQQLKNKLAEMQALFGMGALIC